MKKLIIILFVIVGLGKANAQTFHTYADTANYLIHQIENKKVLYVGYPLSKLMDSLKIKPVIVSTPGLSEQQGFGKVVGLYFNNQSGFSKTHSVILMFSNIPSYATLLNLFFPATGAGGIRQKGSVQSITAVYRTLIISDLWVKDYMEDEPVNPNVHY